jgi:hypothetical protein
MLLTGTTGNPANINKSKANIINEANVLLYFEITLRGKLNRLSDEVNAGTG